MIRIVMPIGGEGKRFAERGFTFPKPLVEIGGHPMVEIVVRNLTPSEPHRFVFVCRDDHVRHFALGDVLKLIAPGCEVVTMRDQTGGALCSALLAVDHLREDAELLIANGDQYLDASVDDFIAAARTRHLDGYIVTFPSTHPKWSYALVENDQVVAVAEKRPISRHATAGLYYFQRCGDFITAAERMLLKNAAVAGEYYVAPVYNELILMGKRIAIHSLPRDRVFSLGTPEDVESFAAMKMHELQW